MTQTAKITSAPFHQHPGGSRREYKSESLGLTIGKVVEILSETPDADGDYHARYTHPDGSPSITYLNKECLTMEPAKFNVGDLVKPRGVSIYPEHDGRDLVVLTKARSGYGVGLLGNDPAKAHNHAEGWLYYNAYALELVAPARKIAPTADDFKPGDRVRVAADAETADGNGVYFGRETEGVVIEPYPCYPGDVNVVAEDSTGRELGQWVGAAYLTKLADAPAEEPLADRERELLGEFRTGDKVIVAANAKWTDGTGTSVTADGQPREATIDHDYTDGDYRVRTENGLFVVGHRYLELAPADAKVDEPVVGRLAVGTRVRPTASGVGKYRSHKGEDLVVHAVLDHGYGVGRVGTDPSRSHDPEDGWLYYSEHEVEVEVEEPIEVSRETVTGPEARLRKAAEILGEITGYAPNADDLLKVARYLDGAH